MTAQELAARLGGRLCGAADRTLVAVAPLGRAGPQHLSFCADRKYREALRATAAGAVILSEELAGEYGGTAIVVDNPQLGFARAAAWLHAATPAPPGCDPRAHVDPQARVDAAASVGALAVIEAGAVVGPQARIGPGCYLGRDCQVGARTRLVAQVVIAHDCVVGEDCLIHPGAVIGADGFGYARDGERWVKVPQLGRVVIGDHVEVGANTAIDRGTLDDTVIGDGVKLDNLIHLAHNVRIGEHTAIAACCGIAGSTTVGRRCTIGGMAGIAGHLTIGDDVHITGASLVTSSIERPGVYSSSLKAEPVEKWRRNAARVHQLDELARRLIALERRTQNPPKEP